MKCIIFSKCLLMVFIAFVLSACGGGGGGSSDKEEIVDTISSDDSDSDPLYRDQWHLKNTGQTGFDQNAGMAGEDINVEPVWDSCLDNSCRGEGIRIVVVDDGIEMTHEDLKENMVFGKSYNYINQDTNPPPGEHGTSVAGIIAAQDLNNYGGRGVSPRAKLVGYNVLVASTSENESDAMTRDVAQNYVSNNSWGVPDGSGDISPSTAIWRSAINMGHQTGRNGLGTIYVWAAGNGYLEGDNSNYDGYANYRGVIAVGAVTHLGERAYYSEQGANLLVSAPGGEGCDTDGIVTTDLTGSAGSNSGFFGSGVDDLSNNNYTACFNGTSAATPIVSGVVALILQANPHLGWRDVHAILAYSARKNDVSNPDWQTNGAGLTINHNYGFGVVDANAAVVLAKSWTNLEQEKIISTPIKQVNQAIGDDDGVAVRSTLNVVSSGISKIEFIEIQFSAEHTYAGDLEITLVNVTTGTTSRLAETHTCSGNSCSPYSNWRFGSTRHLGESADGDWQLVVEDKTAADNGHFQSWKLTFYGT